MFQFKIILSEHDSHFEDNILNGLAQLIETINLGNAILFQTIFIAVASEIDYQQKKETLIKYLNKNGLNNIPTSFVAQKPYKQDLIFEIAYINNVDIKIEDKMVDGIPYRVLHSPLYSQIMAFGLLGNGATDLKQKSIIAFEQAKAILKNENADFSDIVRQWNYIENITCELKTQNEISQHYQIFNDVRSHYYADCCFTNGYPAATGIGMQAGGVIIDFIAIKENSKVQITPMVNPNQIDAHRYSTEVLIGQPMAGKKTTPKFERAKALVADTAVIFVSGTAAIQGELTVNTSSVQEQTHETLLNIEKLISKDNLKQHNIPTTHNLNCQQLRIYVREGENIEEVNQVIKSNYPNTPFILLNGNVCRNDLLVEIEGIFGK